MPLDPDIPGPPGSPALFQGDVTRLTVIDPQPFSHGVGNHVIDPTRDFTIRVEWEVFGQFAPLFLGNGAPNWVVRAFAESIGPGPELRISQNITVPTNGTPVADINRPNLETFAATLLVTAGTLPEDVAANSGIYKLVTTVFLNSNTAGVPGYDVAGYREGPIIQVESQA